MSENLRIFTCRLFSVGVWRKEGAKRRKGERKWQLIYQGENSHSSVFGNIFAFRICYFNKCIILCSCKIKNPMQQLFHNLIFYLFNFRFVSGCHTEPVLICQFCRVPFSARNTNKEKSKQHRHHQSESSPQVSCRGLSSLGVV